MRVRKAIAVAVFYAFSGLMPASLAEEGVRYYEQNGVMYRETRIKIRHPINEVKYKELKRTVYRDQYTTELKPIVRNSYVPVTTYAWQPEVYGKWNPFAQPHIAYRPVPKVSWSVQPQTTQVPVTRRITVPQSQSYQVPETNLRYVEREYVQRVPVGPAPTRRTDNLTSSQPTQSPSGSAAGVPQGTSTAGTQPLQPVYRPPNLTAHPQEVFGGVARFDGDPPRYGTAASAGR